MPCWWSNWFVMLDSSISSWCLAAASITEVRFCKSAFLRFGEDPNPQKMCVDAGWSSLEEEEEEEEPEFAGSGPTLRHVGCFVQAPRCWLLCHSVRVTPASARSEFSDSDDWACCKSSLALSVVKSHFAPACIGHFKQLLSKSEKRFVRTHWL